MVHRILRCLYDGALYSRIYFTDTQMVVFSTGSDRRVALAPMTGKFKPHFQSLRLHSNKMVYLISRPIWLCEEDVYLAAHKKIIPYSRFRQSKTREAGLDLIKTDYEGLLTVPFGAFHRQIHRPCTMFE